MDLFIINKENFFGQIPSPLTQFEVRDLIVLNIPVLNNLYLSVTNIILYLSILNNFIILYNNINI